MERDVLRPQPTRRQSLNLVRMRSSASVRSGFTKRASPWRWLANALSNSYTGRGGLVGCGSRSSGQLCGQTSQVSMPALTRRMKKVSVDFWRRGPLR